MHKLFLFQIFCFFIHSFQFCCRKHILHQGTGHLHFPNMTQVTQLLGCFQQLLAMASSGGKSEVLGEYDIQLSFNLALILGNINLLKPSNCLIQNGWSYITILFYLGRDRKVRYDLKLVRIHYVQFLKSRSLQPLTLYESSDPVSY